MRLEMNEANAVGLMPFDSEIWDAFRSMKPYKAPGSDRIHAGFYQRFWLLVGESVRNEVKQIFASQKVPDFLNQTLIASTLSIKLFLKSWLTVLGPFYLSSSLPCKRPFCKEEEELIM